MDQALNIPATATVARKLPERAVIAGFLFASALFLFLDSRTAPIVLWDESRNVVNALEMRARGFGLVSTYDFRPDLWNTKPPLLIWLMTASMQLFGPTEWAMRLPSALAALGALLCQILFVRRVTNSLGTALLAATLLLLSPGFFGEHGARTADFDALLLFLVTAALQLLFFAVHRRRPAAGRMAAIGALIALAAMTKSIAGLIPFAGAIAYVLLRGRFGRMLGAWSSYATAAAIALTPLLVFYVVRDLPAPGYLAAVLHNDLGGRFSQSLIGETTMPSLYAGELFLGWFFAGPLLLAVPLTFRANRFKARALMSWSICVVIGVLLIYSTSSTRLIHYSLPAFPWLAIAAALALRALVERFISVPWRSSGRAVACAAALALALLGGQLTVRAFHWRYQAFPARQFYAQASYGELFQHVRSRGVKAVTVVDPGFPLEGKPGYVPLLRAYRLIWREHGLATHHVARMPRVVREPLVTCEPGVAGRWTGQRMERLDGCAILWPKG